MLMRKLGPFLSLKVEDGVATLNDYTGVIKVLPMNSAGMVLEVFGKTATLYGAPGGDVFGLTEELTKIFEEVA